ncbi:radical SAM family heme chaperone HemW [Jejudonia soesokkakensis]|uniref:Heme chaperone HemW n=1 Tax=Jejudonia soesokkakensis TaxID=1323432 RepID=A0ABW2MSX6_9FLAO
MSTDKKNSGGIYIHIPFCKQACHYCDFHFSTSLKHKDRMIAAICTELALRKVEMKVPVQTIYFGGGTPSLLTSEEITTIIKTVSSNFNVLPNPEITLEANPDDLSEAVLKALAASPINRLSIGVQSFFEKDLKLMNRAHNAYEAKISIQLAKQYFTNISIDLIYGIPQMSTKRWLSNVNKALALDIPHFSCYALTVEPKTALENFIKKGIIPPVEDDVAQEHHAALIEKMEAAGYDNYEFSNFSKPGWESQNNMAYWQGRPYLGVGPSGHSYDGETRSWNVANNSKYLKSIEKNELPLEREQLSVIDKYNEYVMTRLRTKNGVLLSEIRENFGEKYEQYVRTQADQYIQSGHVELSEDKLRVTKKGKFLSDGIASGLFLVNW